jgi:hypothetical protein
LVLIILASIFNFPPAFACLSNAFGGILVKVFGQVLTKFKFA